MVREYEPLTEKYHSLEEENEASFGEGVGGWDGLDKLSIE